MYLAVLTYPQGVLFLIISGFSKTTPSLWSCSATIFPSDQNVIYVGNHILYTIKNMLHFPVKHLLCQTQVKWQPEETIFQRNSSACTNMHSVSLRHLLKSWCCKIFGSNPLSIHPNISSFTNRKSSFFTYIYVIISSLLISKRLTDGYTQSPGISVHSLMPRALSLCSSSFRALLHLTL